MFNTNHLVNNYPTNLGIRNSNEIKYQFFFKPKKSSIIRQPKNPFDIIYSKGGYIDISNPAKILQGTGLAIFPRPLPYGGFEPYLKPLK